MKSEARQGLFWIVVGGAIFYASWTMDRLGNLGVQPFSAPGLLPGVLGVFITVLGLAMFLRRRELIEAPIEWRRILLPLVLCLGFAGGMVGRGVPFWLAGWIFIAVMIWTLQYRERKSQLRKLALLAITVGGIASVAISFLFQYLFLIRLP